ncbi:MAG: LamG-like jellyroll fold domain-containing protein [Thermoguttaceae bacterium]
MNRWIHLLVFGLPRVVALAALAPLPIAPAGTAAGQSSQESPVLELRFDGNLKDSSASRQDGTPHGSIGFPPGKHGQAASLDGQCWIDTGLLQDRLGDEFTVECWVQPDDRQNVHADIFGNHVGEGLGLVLQQDGSQVNLFRAAYGKGTKDWVMTDPAALASRRWQHVAMVKTRDELRLYVNGILVAARESKAPALPSPMPLAVGLGYTDPQRCFRGLIDDFRVWNTAKEDFRHADIDPAAAQETLAQCLHGAPRPIAGPPVRSWTVASEDTRVVLAVTRASELVVAELSSPAAGWNWIAHPVAMSWWPRAEVGGESRPLTWRFVEARAGDGDDRQLAFTFACDYPKLELTSRWTADPGPGPVRHAVCLRNLSQQPVTVGEQPTFDLDLTGAAELWYFHSDGGTPDPVGVYRHPLGGKETRSRHTVQTAPSGEFIPCVVFSSDQAHGVYLGLEWSCCRIETVGLEGAAGTVRVRGGNLADLRVELAPGRSLELRPGFVGAYRGDLDDGGNRLRRWLLDRCVPDIIRQDPTYPKVQWNAFGATGKSPGSWDPVEAKYYSLVDDIAALGFEEVMIDVGWWQGGEPDSDQADWPSGMKKAADHAHAKGMRFGLYWTDDLDMANPEARRQRADRIGRLFGEYGADMWRSDMTRGAVLDASFAATAGFYEMLDTLAGQLPGFQWENCSGGGRIKDYGAMRRAVKIFNSDTYSALHVRQAFYDSSHVLHPVQLEGHLGSIDGRYRPQGAAGIRYAFRSASLGAPEWFLDAPNGGNGSAPWTPEEKDAAKACVETYKTRLRPLVRKGDLYHVLPRPDGSHRDGIEYFDPERQQGVLYVFQPSSASPADPIRFRGVQADRSYRVTFEDGTRPSSVISGRVLLDGGLEVPLDGDESSELVFFEAE